MLYDHIVDSTAIGQRFKEQFEKLQSHAGQCMGIVICDEMLESKVKEIVSRMSECHESKSH
jgi:hypothetical protein